MSTVIIDRLLRLLRGPAPIYLAAIVLARLGAMLLIPLYTRKLSPDEYGDFALAQSVLSFLPLVFTLGLISAVPKFYYREADREAGRENAGSVALWLAVFTITFALLSSTGVNLFLTTGNDHLRYLLTCINVAAAGAALASVPDMFFRSAQRPYLAVSYQLLQFFLQLGLGLLFVLRLGRGLTGAIEALTIAYAVSGLAGLLFIIFYLRGKLNRAVLKQALPFALPFIPHFIANWSLLAADRWAMKLFHLEGELGGYVLAVQLTSPIAMLAAAWNDAETARMGEMFRERGVGGIRAAVPRIRRGYLLVALLPAIALVAATPILSALIGSRFVSALHLVPFMAAFSVIETMYIPNSNVLYYASRTRTIAAITISSALLNVGLNFALIPFLGGTGALIARFTTGVARSVAIWRAAESCLSAADRSSGTPEPAEIVTALDAPSTTTTKSAEDSSR